MKLLFDQNLSPRLGKALEADFPDSLHVQAVSLANADDEAIWEYARAHDFVIVTKDNDFNDRNQLFGFPPKVIWLRRGNCSTQDIISIFQNKSAAIKQLLENQENGLLILY